MQLILIAAVAQNNAIGKQNTIPWKLPTDMKLFKSFTEGYVVIMGRKTFESMGSKPLKNRINVVISNTLPDTPGVVVSTSVPAALEAFRDYEKCFIIGGAGIYQEAMPLADKLIISHVDKVVEDADAFFPTIPFEWHPSETFLPELTENDEVTFKVITYTK